MADTIFHIILVTLPVAYTLLLLGYAKLFLKQASPLADKSRLLLAVTLVVHVGAMILRGVEVQGCPMGRYPEFLSLLAVSMAVTYFVLESRTGERSTGVFMIGLVLLTQIVATVSILVAEGPGSYPEGMWESLHVFAAIVGYSAVVVASLYGLLYLFLYTCIKRGRFGRFYQNMPSLEILTRLNFVAATVGFVALSVTLGVGVILWQRGVEIHFLQPEVLLTVVLWCLYGLSVTAHRVLRIGGKKLAYSTLLGILIVIGFVVGIAATNEFHG